MLKAFGKINTQASLQTIVNKTGVSLPEVTAYYNKVLAFLDKHTSCDGVKAVAIALNETLGYYSVS